MVDLVPQYRLGDGPGAGEAFRTAEEQSRQARLRAEQEARARFTAEQNAAYQQGQLSLAQQTAQRNAATAAYNRKRQAELDAYNRKRQEVLDQRAATTWRQQQEAFNRQEARAKERLAQGQRPLPLSSLAPRFPGGPGVRLPDTVTFTPITPTPGVTQAPPPMPTLLQQSTQLGAPQPPAAPPAAAAAPPSTPSTAAASPSTPFDAQPGATIVPPGVRPSAVQPTVETRIRGTEVARPDTATQAPLGAPSVATNTFQGAPAKYPEVGYRYLNYGSAAADLVPVPPIPSEELPISTVDKMARDRRSAHRTNIGRIRKSLSPVASRSAVYARRGSISGQRYNRREVDEIAQWESDRRAADKWLGSAKALKLFDANPELYEQAGRDPVAFYKQYKNVSPSDVRPTQTPEAAAARVVDPATPLNFGTAEAEKAIQDAINPGRTAGPPSRIVAAVTGARTPAKIQRIDVSYFRANPAALTYEVQQAEALYQLMDQRRRELIKDWFAFRGTPGAEKLYTEAVDLRARMIGQARLVFDARGRAAVDQFELSGGADVVGLDRAASILYGRNIQHELTQDPQTGARVIKRYADGKLFQGTMKIKDLATEYRSRFDAAYKQSVAAAAKTRQEQIGKERIEGIKNEGRMRVEEYKQLQENLRSEGFTKVWENPNDGSVLLQGKRMYVDRYGRNRFETVLLKRNQTSGQVTSETNPQLRPEMQIVGTTNSFGVPTTAPTQTVPGISVGR